MGMDQRDSVRRSLDHNDAMERQKGFTEWEEIKFGIGPWLAAFLVIGGIVGVIWMLWGSLR